MTEAPRKPCRCLLSESRPDLAATVHDYIDSLPPELLAEPTQRETRLMQCRACEALRDGTCILCGCYVEARSAKRTQHCPAVPPKW